MEDWKLKIGHYLYKCPSGIVIGGCKKKQLLDFGITPINSINDGGYWKFIISPNDLEKLKEHYIINW